MFDNTRITCTLALTVVLGCSDDGVPGQGQNSSSSGTAGDTALDSANVPTGTGGEGDPGGTGSSSGLPSDTTGGEDTEGLTTGEASGTTEAGTEGTTGDTEGTDTEATTTGEVCVPITEDPSNIDAPCMVDADCDPGYTCQVYEGFALDLSCQIICEESCECPMGLTCTFTEDKVKSWFQCEP